eukprot:2092965-Prymnesium_polylepis.1
MEALPTADGRAPQTPPPSPGWGWRPSSERAARPGASTCVPDRACMSMRRLANHTGRGGSLASLAESPHLPYSWNMAPLFAPYRHYSTSC